MLLGMVTNMASGHFCAGHAERRSLQQVTHCCLAHMTAVRSGRPSLLTRLWTDVSLDDTRDGLDLQHIRISHTSLFFMRHKIMLALEDLQEVSPAMAEEAAEADET